MKKLTHKEAVNLSVYKWKTIVENDGNYNSILDDPKLRELNSHCGLCEYCISKQREKSLMNFCEVCPLPNKDKYRDCFNDNSVFIDYWLHIRPSGDTFIHLTDKATLITKAKAMLKKLQEIKNDIILVELK